MLGYERAAGHGFGLAQFHLGLLHAASVGGRSPDNVTACMWLTLAASRLRGDVRDRAIGQRDAVAARMTPAQLVEARRRVREWIAGQPQSR
jgi:hypothetical protein